MYAGCRRPFATLPTQPLEIRRGAGGDPGRRVERLLQPRLARWFASGDLLHQPEGSSATGRNIRCPRSPTMKACRAIICRSASRRNRRTFPTLRKIGGFSAYSEGWALYAEQLADELDAYRRRWSAPAICNPSCSAPRGWSSIPASTPSAGAARRRPIIWSRRPASRGRASQREVERYCTQAGQACSYKVGHMAWTPARADAEECARTQIRPQALPRGPEGRRDAADLASGAHS